MTCATSSISDKKLQANRRNALKSTGPRTTQGKSRSSRNAITHGLFARNLLLPDESSQELHELKMSILKRLNPRDMLELQLVDQIVADCWMGRRARSAEQVLYRTRLVQFQDQQEQRREQELSRLQSQAQECQSHIGTAQIRKYHPELVEEYEQAEEAVKQAEQELDDPLHVPTAAELMMCMFEESDPTLDRLHRYSRRLEYSLNRCLNQLRKLREEWEEQEEMSELVQGICEEEQTAQSQQNDEAEQMCKTKPPQAEEQPGPEDANGGQCSGENESIGGGLVIPSGGVPPNLDTR